MPRKSSSTPADRSKVSRAQLEPIRQQWTERCEDGFLALKKMLTTAPALGFADFSKPRPMSLSRLQRKNLHPFRPKL